jgi:hypothetical protein
VLNDRWITSDETARGISSAGKEDPAFAAAGAAGGQRRVLPASLQRLQRRVDAQLGPEGRSIRWLWDFFAYPLWLAFPHAAFGRGWMRVVEPGPGRARHARASIRLDTVWAIVSGLRFSTAAVFWFMVLGAAAFGLILWFGNEPYVSVFGRGVRFRAFYATVFVSAIVGYVFVTVLTIERYLSARFILELLWSNHRHMRVSRHALRATRQHWGLGTPEEAQAPSLDRIVTLLALADTANRARGSMSALAYFPAAILSLVIVGRAGYFDAMYTPPVVYAVVGLLALVSFALALGYELRCTQLQRRCAELGRILIARLRIELDSSKKHEVLENADRAFAVVAGNLPTGLTALSGSAAIRSLVAAIGAWALTVVGTTLGR